MDAEAIGANNPSGLGATTIGLDNAKDNGKSVLGNIPFVSGLLKVGLEQSLSLSGMSIESSLNISGLAPLKGNILRGQGKSR